MFYLLSFLLIGIFLMSILFILALIVIRCWSDITSVFKSSFWHIGNNIIHTSNFNI